MDPLSMGMSMMPMIGQGMEAANKGMELAGKGMEFGGKIVDLLSKMLDAKNGGEDKDQGKCCEDAHQKNSMKLTMETSSSPFKY